MDLSPYLNAIQSINGQNPGDKYKELHAIAAQIIDNEKERDDFVKTGITDRVKPAMFPHLRILVGNKLKSKDAIIEALRSDDVSVIKQALNAKWFFNPSNDLITVDYFVNNVIPLISLRTRLELVKIIAHCLINESQRAEDFFGKFADLYGLDQGLPLIVACSEDYIFNAVLHRRIVLPSRILGVLYRRYPKLVIRYLQLGNEENETNKEERKLHTISLVDYNRFLPVLVKYHTQVFIELSEYVMKKHHTINILGTTRAEFFLKNATDVLIKKPNVFLPILPLKIVSNKLTTQQFETMLENLYPKQESSFSMYTIIKYLKYYPEEKQFTLIRDKYNKVYNKDLIDKVNVLSAPSFYKLLPSKVKEDLGRKSLESLVGKPDYQSCLYYLPPRESIPMLKEKISKPSDKSRSYWINQMIKTCSLYSSNADLLEVLRYYNKRHKNERIDTLNDMLETLTSEYDLKKLDRQHWLELKDIIQRTYIKGDLFQVPCYTIAPIFEGAFSHFSKQCKVEPVNEEDKIFVNKLIDIKIENQFEHNVRFAYFSDSSEIDIVKEYFTKYLSAVPQKYPDDHAVWKNINKETLVIDILQETYDFNVKNLSTKRKKRYNKTFKDFEGNEINQSKILIKDYHWLVNLIKEFLNIETDNWSKLWNLKKIRQLVRKHDLEMYQNIIDQEPEYINDVDSDDAILILRYHRHKILGKWKQYLNSCRKKLDKGSRSARQFVAATKWYQDLPIKFTDQCLAEIEEKGSIFVLGILLEGQVFGELIKPYLPKDKHLDIEDESAKKTYELRASLPKAINFGNPPVSFDIIASLCQGDYVSLAAQTLTNVAQRVPIDKVMTFADNLVDKAIAVRKLGIRLILQVAAKKDVLEFLSKVWKNEKSSSIREVMVRMVFDTFIKTPNKATWELIKTCINELTKDDAEILMSLVEIKNIDKDFVTIYVVEILKKIDSYTEDELDTANRIRILHTLATRIDGRIMNLLPEELITDIVKRNFFITGSHTLIETYLYSDENKFETRLKVFLDVLQARIKECNVPDPKKPRYYPANFDLRRFVESVKSQMVSKKYDNVNRVIDEIYKLVGKILKPWQEVMVFVYLYLGKVYYESEIPSSPKSYGEKIGKKLDEIMTACKSELFLQKFADEIRDINSSIYGREEENIMDVIEGLMMTEGYNTTMVSLNLLNHYEMRNYDDRYDKFIELWRANPNPNVQAVLSEYINQIQEYQAETNNYC